MFVEQKKNRFIYKIVFFFAHMLTVCNVCVRDRQFFCILKEILSPWLYNSNSGVHTKCIKGLMYVQFQEELNVFIHEKSIAIFRCIFSLSQIMQKG